MKGHKEAHQKAAHEGVSQMKNNRVNRLLCCVFLALMFSSCAKRDGDVVVIENVFIKELSPGQSSTEVYLQITNNTEVSQPLNYVHSPIADYVEVHRTFYQDGKMQMRTIKKVTVNPGETKLMQPGGFHLMMFGIYGSLEIGDTFEVTFEFESGLVITTFAEVKPRG